LAVRSWLPSLPLVLSLVEAEGDLRTADQNGPPDEIRLFHHQIDRLSLRLRQRTLLEYRAAPADEIQEVVMADVFLEEGAIRRILVDVTLLDVDSLLLQKTSGVAAGGSRGLPIEDRLRHGQIVSGEPYNRNLC
jgi:hypothetical protein